MSLRLISSRRCFADGRKAKTKLMSYTCIPESMKPAWKDPFAYKLRSKKEVLDDLKYRLP